MRAGVTGLRETGLGVWWFGCWRQLSRQYTLPFSSLMFGIDTPICRSRKRRVEGATCCERSNVHQATWRKQSSLVGGGIPSCMSRRVLCVVFGPCIRAGRDYQHGSYVLCVWRPLLMLRATNLIGGHVGPCWSRRDDPPGRVGCLRGSVPLRFYQSPLSIIDGFGG